MATYPKLPPTLEALVATASDPQPTEDAGKLVDAIRQTRSWLYDYCSRFFDDATGALKPAAFNSQGGSLPPGYIRGTNVSTTPATEREIAQGTVTGYDIAQRAITNPLFADGSLTNEKFADGTIQGSKFANGSISPVKLQGNLSASMLKDGAIETTNIANKAVTSLKLADLAVGTDHIANRAVDGTKLSEAPAGYILVGGNTIDGETNCFVPRQLGGAFKIDANGNVIVAAGVSSMYARVVETAPPGVDCATGDIGSLTGNYRGSKVPWKQLFDRDDLLDVSDNNEAIGIKKDGTYLFMVRAPAYRVGSHRAALHIYPNASAPTERQTYYGTCEFSATGVANAVTYSEIFALVKTKNATQNVIPYFRVEHIVQSIAEAARSFGKAAGIAGVFETYAEISIFKLT